MLLLVGKGASRNFFLSYSSTIDCLRTCALVTLHSWPLKCSLSLAALLFFMKSSAVNLSVFQEQCVALHVLKKRRDTHIY